MYSPHFFPVLFVNTITMHKDTSSSNFPSYCSSLLFQLPIVLNTGSVIQQQCACLSQLIVSKEFMEGKKNSWKEISQAGVSDHKNDENFCHLKIFHYMVLTSCRD